PHWRTSKPRRRATRPCSTRSDASWTIARHGFGVHNEDRRHVPEEAWRRSSRAPKARPFERARSPGHSVTCAQLRSERGAGGVTAGAMSVVVVVVVSVGAVEFSVLAGLVVVVVLFGMALLSVVVVEVDCAAGIADESVDCATAAPMPASNAAAAATADNFF